MYRPPGPRQHPLTNRDPRRAPLRVCTAPLRGVVAIAPAL